MAVNHMHDYSVKTDREGQIALAEATDKSLIQAHTEGDSAAFEQIVRRHGAAVFGYLKKMTGDYQLAEDFFQETFKRVDEKANTLRGGRFKSWLFQIATRVAVDGFRKQKKARTVSLDEQTDCMDAEGNVALADVSTEPAEEAIKAEKIQQVRKSIMELPTKQRATLILAYYQQLSYQEVAQSLGCSVGTVKRQMFSALKKLAKQLPDFAGETR